MSLVSYVRENQELVDRLCNDLRQHSIDVWIDRKEIQPGQRWKEAIRSAIESGSFFIACFSAEYTSRTRTFMNEELTAAIEELRMRPTDRTWFIPVLLSDCSIPDREISGGQSLRDIQYASLYEDWQQGLHQIIKTINPERAKREEVRLRAEQSRKKYGYNGKHGEGICPRCGGSYYFSHRGRGDARVIKCEDCGDKTAYY